MSAAWPHLRSVPHHRGPGVSQLVSARSLIVMPQEDITLYLQNTHAETGNLQNTEHLQTDSETV